MLLVHNDRLNAKAGNQRGWMHAIQEGSLPATCRSARDSVGWGVRQAKADVADMERTTLEDIAQVDPELEAEERLVVKQMERKATDAIAALDVVRT
jgi:hypothetical protein